MAGKESIEFDFRKAKNQAKQLDEVADRLSQLSDRKFANAMQRLAANWKGENASLYLEKGGRLQEQMDGTVRELHSIASDIRRIAKRLYDAEMAAISLAQKRDY